MWLRNKTVQRLCGGGFLEQLGMDVWSWLLIQALRTRKPSQEVKLLRQIRKERKCLNSAYECYNIMSIARAMTKLPGAFAEVGCYQGATAKLMCEVKGDKPLLLFDTFEGLPADSSKDAGVHREGTFAVSLERVQSYLADYQNVQYYKGLFPDSTADVPEQKYSFVHFDVDLYEGTYACLEYFYPRMTPGGILLSHDYSVLQGVEQAFHDFMADKPEPLIPYPTTQVMIIKQASVTEAAQQPSEVESPAGAPVLGSA